MIVTRKNRVTMVRKSRVTMVRKSRVTMARKIMVTTAGMTWMTWMKMPRGQLVQMLMGMKSNNWGLLDSDFHNKSS